MPLAVDTNVLARAIVDDGSGQAERSRQCFIDHDVFIADSVLLETEWLLRSRLKIPRDEVVRLFSRLLAAPTTFFDDSSRVGDAILAHAKGLDFADAMHLLAAKHCDAFVTFDRDFIRRSHAVEDGIVVREP